MRQHRQTDDDVRLGGTEDDGCGWHGRYAMEMTMWPGKARFNIQL
jgi:hypothetical protein